MRLVLTVDIPAAALAGEPIFQLSQAQQRHEGVTIVTPTGYKVDCDLVKVEPFDPFKIMEVPD
jgi:hypothetical protein